MAQRSGDGGARGGEVGVCGWLEKYPLKGGSRGSMEGRLGRGTTFGM